LALLSCWRLREEDVPRIALLSAAFFVASSIHVKLGPTSVHLLLAGLVGVLLTWRAPVAILFGGVLPQVILGHGGLSTRGVNACTQALPALLVAGGFVLLRRAGLSRSRWGRAGLVGLTAGLWAWCVVLGVVVLWTNPLRDLVRFSPRAGL